MLQNAYLLAKIGGDTAENERSFAEILPKIGNYPKLSRRKLEDARAVREEVRHQLHAHRPLGGGRKEGRSPSARCELKFARRAEDFINMEWVTSN